MVYKIGNIRDVAFLPLKDEEVRRVIYKQARILSDEYGEYRDVDKDDGGYILYVKPGTSPQDIKNSFDYSKATPEQVDVVEMSTCKLFSALYMLNNEYSITLIMHEKEVPKEILEEV